MAIGESEVSGSMHGAHVGSTLGGIHGRANQFAIRQLNVVFLHKRLVIADVIRADLVAEARYLRELCRGTRFVVNDRVDVGL